MLFNLIFQIVVSLYSFANVQFPLIGQYLEKTKSILLNKVLYLIFLKILLLQYTK